MNNRLNIQDLAGLLSEYTGKEKAEIEQFLKCLISVVTEGVCSDKLVKIKGLGTFKIVVVEKRESVNVNTGERFLIPAHYKFSFLPDKDLREQVNKPFSAFETTEIRENVNFSDMEESVEDAEKDKEVEDESVEEVIPEKEVKPEETEPRQPVETLTDKKEEEVPAQEEVQEEFPTPAEAPAKEEAQTPIQKEVIPVIEADPIVEVPKKKEKNILLYVALILTVILLSIGCFTLGRYYCFPDPIVVQMEVPAEPVETAVTSDVVDNDVPENQEDSGIQRPDESNRDSELEKEPLADAKTKEPLAKVEIKHGDRLTVFALKYYGNKLFWVYIYMHNKAVIADPNNVPIGTIVEIPNPEMYGIDAKSSSSRAKAAALQTEILTGN